MVHRGESLYPEGDPLFRPDIVFEQGDSVHTFGAVGHGSVIDEPDQWRAENVPEGLFLAHGSGVPGRGDIGEISILNISPTILYAMDQPIPEDFKGEPLEMVNQKRDEPTFREPLPDRGEAATTPANATRDRLSDLGYIE